MCSRQTYADRITSMFGVIKIRLWLFTALLGYIYEIELEIFPHHFQVWSNLTLCNSKDRQLFVIIISAR